MTLSSRFVDNSSSHALGISIGYNKGEASAPTTSLHRHTAHTAPLRRCMIRVIRGANGESKESLIDQLPDNICPILDPASRSSGHYAGEVFGIASVQRCGIFVVDCGYAEDASMTSNDSLAYYLQGASKLVVPVSFSSFTKARESSSKSKVNLGIITCLMDKLLSESSQPVSVSFFSFASIDQGVTDLFIQLLPVMESRKVACTREARHSATLCAINVTSLGQFSELISHVTSSYPFRMSRPHLSFCFVIKGADQVVNTVVIVRPEHQSDVINILDGNTSRLSEQVQEMIRFEEVVNGVDIHHGQADIQNIYGSYAGLQHIPYDAMSGHGVGTSVYKSIFGEMQHKQAGKTNLKARETGEMPLVNVSPEEMEANRPRRLLAANVFAQLRRTMSVFNRREHMVDYFKPLYTVRIVEGHTVDTLGMIPFIMSKCSTDGSSGAGDDSTFVPQTQLMKHRHSDVPLSGTRDYWTTPNVSRPTAEDGIFRSALKLKSAGGRGNGNPQGQRRHHVAESIIKAHNSWRRRIDEVMTPEGRRSYLSPKSEKQMRPNIVTEVSIKHHSSHRANYNSIVNRGATGRVMSPSFNSDFSSPIFNSKQEEPTRNTICQPFYTPKHTQIDSQDHLQDSLEESSEYKDAAVMEKLMRLNEIIVGQSGSNELPTTDPKAIQNLENEKEIAIKSIIEIQENCEKLLCELSNLVGRHEPMREMLRSENREIAIIEQNEKAAEGRMRQLEKLIETANQEIEDIHGEINQIDAKHRELGSSKVSLLAKQEESERDLREKKETLDRSHANNLAKIRNEGENEVWELKEKIESAKKDNAQSESFIKREIEEITRESEALLNTISNFERSIQVSNIKQVSLDAEKQKKEKKISEFYELDKCLSEIKAENKILHDKLKKAKSESSALEKDIHHLEVRAPPVSAEGSSSMSTSECHKLHKESLQSVCDAEHFLMEQRLKWLHSGELKVLNSDECMERNQLLLKQFVWMLNDAIPLWRNTEKICTDMHVL